MRLVRISKWYVLNIECKTKFLYSYQSLYKNHIHCNESSGSHTSDTFYFTLIYSFCFTMSSRSSVVPSSVAGEESASAVFSMQRATYAELQRVSYTIIVWFLFTADLILSFTETCGASSRCRRSAEESPRTHRRERHFAHEPCRKTRQPEGINRRGVAQDEAEEVRQLLPRVLSLLCNSHPARQGKTSRTW